MPPKKKNSKTNGPLIFISHSSQDTWIAKQISQEIQKCGATTFLDDFEIEVGVDFEESIRRFINQANELVVLITPSALVRPYVWAEIGAGWGRGIPIIGLLQGMTANELQAMSEIPILLTKHDLISLNEIDTYLTQLRKRVKTMRVRKQK